MVLDGRRSHKTTTERGLDGRHKQQRRQLLPLAYGKPCPLCGNLMLEGQPLDLDHVQPRVMGGAGGPVRMAHRVCNRRAGARLGNRIRKQRRRTLQAWKSRW